MAVLTIVVVAVVLGLRCRCPPESPLLPYATRQGVALTDHGSAEFNQWCGLGGLQRQSASWAARSGTTGDRDPRRRFGHHSLSCNRSQHLLGSNANCAVALLGASTIDGRRTRHLHQGSSHRCRGQAFPIDDGTRSLHRQVLVFSGTKSPFRSGGSNRTFAIPTGWYLIRAAG